MSTLDSTPSATRIHIGVFGKTNSGKSSFVNQFTNQEMSIVSDTPGTTTDTVKKAMEINSLGACLILDTAGFDDKTELAELRMKKMEQAKTQTDIALILLVAPENREWRNRPFRDAFSYEYELYQYFQQHKKPCIFIINKIDLMQEYEGFLNYVKEETKEEVVCISAFEGRGISRVREVLQKHMPKDVENASLLGNLVGKNDVVLLVMPQDIQAPKGRLILPQVQTIRALLDRKCLVQCTTTDTLEQMLACLKNPPDLVITDSQEFETVAQTIPKGCRLTSFSILFAAYKGDLDYYVKSVSVIDKLTEQSIVLIAECCTHAPMEEDIGRVKIPAILRKKVGDGLRIEIVSGEDFPQDLSKYDLIIQCGGCMFNRSYILSRIERAKAFQVPMTNYGVALAHMKGILKKINLSL